MIQRVCVNLLSNALKYSPENPQVKCTLEQLKDQDRFRIAIVDKGIGMSTDELARLGERFWCADTSGKTRGTGLGVTLAYEIIKLHQGTIDVESSPGEGTTVTVTLPNGF